MIADREQPLTTRDEPSANAVAAAMTAMTVLFHPHLI